MVDAHMMTQSCEDFVTALAAREPVPGGGGAAAYVGALSAALCSMVGNYTVGKRASAEVEREVRRMLGEAETLRMRLVELVQEDAEAFYPLSRAYAIPRDDPKRAACIEEASKWACAAPLETMRQVCRTIELLEELSEKGSRMLLSDVGCGSLFARAALEAASINVFVNTAALRDRSFAQVTEEEVDAMLDEFVPRAEACSASVMAKVRG